MLPVKSGVKVLVDDFSNLLMREASPKFALRHREQGGADPLLRRPGGRISRLARLARWDSLGRGLHCQARRAWHEATEGLDIIFSSAPSLPSSFLRAIVKFAGIQM